MPGSYLQPQNLIDEEILTLRQIYFGRKNYLQALPKGYETFFEDCAKISLFLQDTQAVLGHLKTLNGLLITEAKERNLSVDDDKKCGYLQHKKVLRSVLEQELAKIGFEPDLGKALGVLENSTFAQIYSKGVLLKDPGAGVEHGEFTHPIQWLIIGWQQQDTAFLSLPVLKMFSRFGEDPKFLLIWDTVVDQIKEACTDARSPERLHTMILNSDDPDLSLLKILCQSRVKKREMNNQKDTFFLSRKLIRIKNTSPRKIKICYIRSKRTTKK